MAVSATAPRRVSRFSLTTLTKSPEPGVPLYTRAGNPIIAVLSTEVGSKTVVTERTEGE